MFLNAEAQSAQRENAEKDGVCERIGGRRVAGPPLRFIRAGTYRVPQAEACATSSGRRLRGVDLGNKSLEDAPNKCLVGRAHSG